MNHNQNGCQCKRPCWCTWLRWLVAAILAFLLLRGCMASKAVDTTAAVTAPAAAVATAPVATPTTAPATTVAPAQTDMAKNAACVDTLKMVVEFDTASAKLTAKGATQLDAVSECLKEGKFEVAGHTDAQGNDAANQALSETRAKSVVAYLTKKGVENGRMTAKGYGESQPIASNDTAEGRQQNRRIAFVSMP